MLQSVKLLISVLAIATLAKADSNPSWWNYASPDATALVGINWENLRESPLAGALSAELSSPAGMGFPSIDCLMQARQMVISSPAFLAMAAGSFPSATLKQQAAHAGMRGIKYKGIAMWLPQKAADLGVAQISEQLLLVGSIKTLEAAIDNSLAENARRYSPLLPHAARFSQTADLWVVSTRLPDPLANRFVPIEGAAQSFEGSVSVRNGLDVEAWLDAGSPNLGVALARAIRQASAGFPEFARSLQVTEGAGKVGLTLELSPEELSAALKSDSDQQPALAVKAPKPEPAPAPTAAPAVVAKAAAPVPAPVSAVAPEPVPPVPVKPLVIRIVGLDGGPREIPFPQHP